MLMSAMLKTVHLIVEILHKTLKTVITRQVITTRAEQNSVDWSHYAHLKFPLCHLTRCHFCFMASHHFCLRLLTSQIWNLVSFLVFLLISSPTLSDKYQIS